MCGVENCAGVAGLLGKYPFYKYLQAVGPSLQVTDCDG